MDPHSQNESLTNAINNHIYESLVGRDARFKTEPALAVRWEAVAYVAPPDTLVLIQTFIEHPD